MKRNVSKCAKDVTNTPENAAASADTDTVVDIDADKYTETDADIVDTAFTCILQQLTALCPVSLLHFSGLVFHIVYSGFFPLLGDLFDIPCGFFPSTFPCFYQSAKEAQSDPL